jgi:hypothetical protein
MLIHVKLKKPQRVGKKSTKNYSQTKRDFDNNNDRKLEIIYYDSKITT